MKINPDVKKFFKEHKLFDEKMFKYLENQSTMVDYDDPDQRCFVGCFYILDRTGTKLTDIRLNLPYVNSEETMLISIHELTHAIFNYPKIGKKFKKDITIEVLPLLYEKIYAEEHPSKWLQAYLHRLDGMTHEKCPEYAYGLAAREKLYEIYQNNPEKMAKIVEKMSQEYQFEQFKNKFRHK